MKVSKFLLIFFLAVSINGFSQTPTDYLSKEFHQDKRQELRKKLPKNSVAVFFANSFVELISVYGILGMLTIFLALNLAHDAAHGTFFKQKKHNKILLNIFDLLGASGYIWKSKHIYSHHPYVNISDVDQELKQSSIVRIFPNSQR